MRALRRALRLHLRLAGLIMPLVGLSACSQAEAASAQGISVQVSPSTVTPGSGVTIRARCGTGTTGAVVVSRAFDATQLRPASGGILRAVVIVPTFTPEGGYDVNLVCRDGATAKTRLTVRAGSIVDNSVGNSSVGDGSAGDDSVGAESVGGPTVGPHTGGGFLASRQGDQSGSIQRLTAVANRLTGPSAWLVAGGLALMTAVAIAAMSARRHSLRLPPGHR